MKSKSTAKYTLLGLSIISYNCRALQPITG